MSLYDYQMSQKIDALRPTFASIIMAALRKADDANAAALRWTWPEITMELERRYHAPEGLLPEEKQESALCPYCGHPKNSASCQRQHP